MGTAPAPDLANDFAFIREFKFHKDMIDEYVHVINSGNEALYPCLLYTSDAADE